MLKLRLGKRIGKACAQDDQRPPQHRAKRIEECRSRLMEPHTPVDGMRETITPRAINGILAEKNEDKEAEQAPEITRCKSQYKKCHIERHQSRDRNQESKQELVGGAEYSKLSPASSVFDHR